MIRPSLLMLLIGPLAACAAPLSAGPGRAPAAFRCDNGVDFTVAYRRGAAILDTPAGVFRLERRPSSIGRKYAAGDATFIHDQDRAALNGIPGQSFRRCRQLGLHRAALGAGR